MWTVGQKGRKAKTMCTFTTKKQGLVYEIKRTAEIVKTACWEHIFEIESVCAQTLSLCQHTKHSTK